MTRNAPQAASLDRRHQPFRTTPLRDIVLLTALLSLACIAPAIADTQVDTIDRNLDAALARDLSVADQLAAIEQAGIDWDNRLNQVYRDLQHHLPERTAEALRRSQRAWLQHRDAEHAALDALYADAEGSLFRPMQALDRLRLLRHRVVELEGWRSTLELRTQ